MSVAEDPGRFVEAAERAADAAGQILRRHFRTAIATEIKADGSPVTVADHLAEAAMRGILRAAHPAHDVSGEEQGGGGGSARFRWVLDPIDGTRAFITGRPLFGTLIALLDGGVPVLGLIDQPISRERWIGCAGRPTRFVGAHGASGTRPRATLGACELACTSPAMFGPPEAPRFAALSGRVARTSFGGDCYAYGLLALGQIDIVAEASLQPWDWAALVPVVHGAGGSITDWSGQPLREGGDGTVLALGDRGLLAEAVAALARTATDCGNGSARTRPAGRAA